MRKNQPNMKRGLGSFVTALQKRFKTISEALQSLKFLVDKLTALKIYDIIIIWVINLGLKD